MFRFLDGVLVYVLSLTLVVDGAARAAGAATPQAAASNIIIDPSASKTTSVTETATPTRVTFAGTASNSVVPASFIDTALRYGDVIVTANANVLVNNAITLTNSGVSNLLLRADQGVIGTGTVKFGPGVQISRTGTVSILFNPSVNPASSVVNTTSYVNPTENYSGNVTGGPLTAYLLVNSIYDLQNIQNNLSGSYALGQSIVANSTAAWNSGAGFIPIGNETTPFTGNLDGQGQSIEGLVIINSNPNIGLFGVLGTQASVRNLGLTSIKYNGTGSQPIVGGIAAQSYAQIISNSYVTGTIVAGGNSYPYGSFAGGIVALNIAGTISNSYTDLSLSNDVGSCACAAFTGGLAGYNGGIITCFTAANNRPMTSPPAPG
jgi:M26 IgA1-specific Metallo-endopeptidase N-terminal region